MSTDLQFVAQNELQPGESLRWTGQPDAARLAMKTLPTFLFAIPWTAFAVFWVWSAAGYRMPDLSRWEWKNIFPLWGVPFILIGLRMLTAPLWEYLRAARIVYAVTDHRALIIQSGGSKKVKSFTAAELSNLDRKEKADGSGDLLFGKPESEETRRTRSFNFGLPIPAGFIGIRDLRMVEQLLLDVAKSQPSKSSGGF